MQTDRIQCGIFWLFSLFATNITEISLGPPFDPRPILSQMHPLHTFQIHISVSSFIISRLLRVPRGFPLDSSEHSSILPCLFTSFISNLISVITVLTCRRHSKGFLSSHHTASWDTNSFVFWSVLLNDAANYWGAIASGCVPQHDIRTRSFWARDLASWENTSDTVTVLQCRELDFYVYPCMQKHEMYWIHDVLTFCLYALTCIILALLLFAILHIISTCYCNLKKVKTFAVFWILYSFFCVIPRRLNFMCRRFGTLCSIFIVGVYTTYEDGIDRVFRNAGT